MFTQNAKLTKIPVVMSSDRSTNCMYMKITNRWKLVLTHLFKSEVIFSHNVNKMWNFSFVQFMCDQATYV